MYTQNENYTYEWLTGGIFSLLVKRPNKEDVRCNYHSETGRFDFFHNDSTSLSVITSLTPAEKEQIKFLLISVLDDFLHDETMFLTTMEPFSK